MRRLITLTIFFIFILVARCSTEPLDEYTRTLAIELGFETSYITYKEPGVMKERGIWAITKREIGKARGEGQGEFNRARNQS